MEKYQVWQWDITICLIQRRKISHTERMVIGDRPDKANGSVVMTLLKRGVHQEIVSIQLSSMQRSNAPAVGQQRTYSENVKERTLSAIVAAKLVI